MTYQVTYDVGDGIYSSNMIEGRGYDVQIEAEAHAKKHGYKLCDICTLEDWEIAKRKAKGMPFQKVGEKA